MRIPNKLTDEFSVTLNKIYARLVKLYFDAVSKRVEVKKVGAILGDATVTEQDTFEPERMSVFLEELAKRLEHWSSSSSSDGGDGSGVEKTRTDDLRRLHMHLVTPLDKYELSCNLAIQYHALLFYRGDREVIEIKKQVFEIDETIAKVKPEMESRQDLLLEEELRKRGLDGLKMQELLSTMYNDEKLFVDLSQKIEEVEKSDRAYHRALEARQLLLERLNGMVFEVYRTKPEVLLDQTGLLQGDEGCAFHFDLQVVKRDGGRSGVIDINKIPDRSRKAVLDRFGEIEAALREIR